MLFKQFISDPFALFKESRVIILRGEVYPALFVHALLQKLVRIGDSNPVVLDLSTAPIGEQLLQLSTSFLGHSSRYWLGDTSQLSPKAGAQLAVFVEHYQGENYIIFFAQQALKGSSVATVTLPEKITQVAMHDLLALYPQEQQKRCQQFIKPLFKRVDTLTLEQAILLLNYASVLGVNREVFLDQWLDLLVKPEESLFELSGLLLARDVRFWCQWSRVRELYEFPFWVSYFGDLFFRAYYYGQYRKNNQLTEAKKIGYRLPFSFIQRDWQKIDYELLRLAHDKLNTIDFQLKNGATPVVLDGVFVQFFE